MKVLFLLKKHLTSGGYESGGYGGQKAGLQNSATFVKEALEEVGIETDLRVVVDGNSIDKEVHQYKPDYCVLEAIWATPSKLRELVKLHPKVQFIVRVHSKISFLTNEGNAIQWIKEYSEIDNVSVCFNEKTTDRDFKSIGIKSFYLPNIYHKIKYEPISIRERIKLILAYLSTSQQNVRKFLRKRFKIDKYKTINVGCFGAIRPMKNQLLQAVAAIAFAEEHKLNLRFHINSIRVEQNGEATLKNLRALFTDNRHELVEHGWLSYKQFNKVVAKMDVGLQMSFSESFNIVSADFVANQVPIISSSEVTWLPLIATCEPTDTLTIRKRIKEAIVNRKLFTQLSAEGLIKETEEALNTWLEFLK